MIQEVKLKKTPEIENQHFWEKYIASRGTAYKWNEHYVDKSYRYVWDKYQLTNNPDSTTTWEQYEVDAPNKEMYKAVSDEYLAANPDEQYYTGQPIGANIYYPMGYESHTVTVTYYARNGNTQVTERTKRRKSDKVSVNVYTGETSPASNVKYGRYSVGQTYEVPSTYNQGLGWEITSGSTNDGWTIGRIEVSLSDKHSFYIYGETRYDPDDCLYYVPQLHTFRVKYIPLITEEEWDADLHSNYPKIKEIDPAIWKDFKFPNGYDRNIKYGLQITGDSRYEVNYDSILNRLNKNIFMYAKDTTNLDPNDIWWAVDDQTAIATERFPTNFNYYRNLGTDYTLSVADYSENIKDYLESSTIQDQLCEKYNTLFGTNYTTTPWYCILTDTRKWKFYPRDTNQQPTFAWEGRTGGLVIVDRTKDYNVFKKTIDGTDYAIFSGVYYIYPEKLTMDDVNLSDVAYRSPYICGYNGSYLTNSVPTGADSLLLRRLEISPEINPQQSDILIDTVTVQNNESAYPDDGIQDGYWWVKQETIYGYEPEYDETPIAQVNSENTNEYPVNGVKNGYWYKKTDDVILTDIKGAFIQEVFNKDQYYYPNNGVANNRYYEFAAQIPDDYYPGSYVGMVSSITSDFPTSGEQDGYWYEEIDTSDGFYPAWTIHNIIGGVSYIQNINPDNDYIIGAVATASIQFETTSKVPLRWDAEYGFFNDGKLVGMFDITKCEKQSSGGYKIEGYDFTNRLNAVVDDLLFNQITYPITLKELFSNLMESCDVPYIDKVTYTNFDFEVNDNFEGTNITAKQVLQYIAEVTGSFAYATAEGKVNLAHYADSVKYLTNTEYKHYNYQEYAVPKVNKLQIQMTVDDIGTVVDLEANDECAYHITNNPLFYAEDAEDNETAAEAILDIMNSVEYVPGEAELLVDYDINCGDIVSIDGNDFYVMEKEISSSGVKLRCFGNQVRENRDGGLNAEIIALRGKTNELIRTIDETQSTISDVEAGLQSQITQTASSLTSSLTSYVDGEIASVNSTITQTANSLSSTITSQGQTITQIQQDLNGISLTYNSQNGTASITIGDVTVTNLVDGQYVSQVVAGIDLTGYVTFSALSTSGQTTINGDNITTGTINANRLNLTGSIAWGDLTSSCQSTIAAYAGSGVPSYIKSTYIDSTTIKSPTIYGAEIYAGTSADGYISMTSNGMNFISSVGGSLIGMGYYPGNYPYPYITLGQGIDGYGTDKGMIKKYSNGIWIGDSDGISDTSEGQGTGIFINFTTGVIYKYINGTATAI